MPFKKGQSGNQKGKPPGTLNKSTKELKEIIQKIVEKELESLPEKLNKLSVKDQMNITIKLLEFILPKNIKDEPVGELEAFFLEALEQGRFQTMSPENDKPLPYFESLK